MQTLQKNIIQGEQTATDGKAFFQPKLTINQPNDVYEQEADAMADHVMNVHDSSSINNNSFFKPSVPSVQRKCAHCEEEDKKAQRKENNNDTTEALPATENYINSLSGGQSLNEKDKSFFESGMGYDLSNVRLHTDNNAAKSAQSINALAYTSGNNIVFNQNQYEPGTDDGKKLLAHELTHVVQQNSGAVQTKLIQRDAGGVKQSKYGDINVDVVQGDIEAAKWQEAYDVLTPLPDMRVMQVLSKLRDIYDVNNLSSLTLLKRNKPAGVQARFDALLFRADNFVSLNPSHADELVGKNDKFELQTFTTTGNPIPDVVLHSNPGTKTTVTKEFSIFLPKGMPADRNQVHVFFTPYVASNPDGAAGFVQEQGLRAQSDASGWILIAVPALDEKDVPNYVTISTSEIQQCLTAAGRPANIDAIRLSAHSRGHRGLERTIGFNGTPLINLSLVEKITVFDASYQDLGTAIASHRKDLTAMTDPSNPNKFKADAVQLYDVTVSNISGLAGTKLDARSMRAIGYARMIQEGLTQGVISQTDLDNALPQNIRDAVKNILAVLPVRGTFSSKSKPPAGQVSIQQFYKDNNSDLMLVDSKEVKAFIGANALDNGHGFSTDIDAHHWFVAELAHEAVE